MQRVVAIVQARMGSTRLPGKVLREILGKPLLGYLVERLRRARKLDEVVIATTNHPRDDVIADFCAEIDVAFHRGQEEDVLSRYVEAARRFGADVVVRISADSPLVDPVVVDELVSEFLDANGKYDYLSNTIDQTYPVGMNVEVFTMAALKAASANAMLPSQREHVTPFIYGQGTALKVCAKHLDRDLRSIRVTVDTEEDFKLVETVFGRLYPENPAFGLGDVISLFDREPALREINAHVGQRST